VFGYRGGWDGKVREINSDQKTQTIGNPEMLNISFFLKWTLTYSTNQNVMDGREFPPEWLKQRRKGNLWKDPQVYKLAFCNNKF
jgi:hypothetical protein